jgi:type I restriction enzyme M protein
MDLKEYILAHFKDFNLAVKTEEDLKVKVLIPYLEELGYTKNKMRFENSIEVQVGTRRTTVNSDIEILVAGKVQLVVDAKNPFSTLSERDMLQSVSYAKLVSTPPALYAVTCNGIDCVTTNIFTGEKSPDIPSHRQLLRHIDRTTTQVLSEVELREVKSVLITLLNPDDLYKIIRRCKDVIEKKGLIRSDSSFREMTKIILVKMNEERRVKDGRKANRFSSEYLEKTARANNVSELEVFISLFREAKGQYPAIYGAHEESFRIQDNECLEQVVALLEPWSFLGTGDDIKGAVYEIFLKSTLRGEFDQYFTPREIVEFIVKLGDPNIGDTILDPACGSGGFLIHAFKHVKHKITEAGLAHPDAKRKFRDLTEKCLWGNDADYDLHVLAKINLIMHGDGYNHITFGDTLQNVVLPSNYFSYVMTNPPFTIKYDFPETLSRYKLGLGKESEELDILFVEKCIDLLKTGGNLFIVLPEGLLNNRRYGYFRDWLLEGVHLVASVSLPEGAFIPFGKSVSKTCILGLRKKCFRDSSFNRPAHVFLGTARKIGYEAGKNTYRPIKDNDLAIFARSLNAVFSGVERTASGGECGWISQDLVSSKRLDASFLLNAVDREALHSSFPRLETLDAVCEIENRTVKPAGQEAYFYLEVPDISPVTGCVSNIRRVAGRKINAAMHEFVSGDLLFTRINPRISRVTIVPETIPHGVVSKEVYRIRLLENSPIIDKYVLCALLQSDHVRNQIVRLATGSSSSRARVQEGDLLSDVFIPIPIERRKKRSVER